jgi:hypothetical protein
MLQALIELYRDKTWATEPVRRARESLAAQNSSEATTKAHPKPK